jgi:hypothetical protein
MTNYVETEPAIFPNLPEVTPFDLGPAAMAVLMLRATEVISLRLLDPRLLGAFGFAQTTFGGIRILHSAWNGKCLISSGGVRPEDKSFRQGGPPERLLFDTER